MSGRKKFATRERAVKAILAMARSTGANPYGMQAYRCRVPSCWTEGVHGDRVRSYHYGRRLGSQRT